MRRYAPILEALALLAVTLPLAIALRLPTLWLLTPLLLITLRQRLYADYGLTWERLGSVGFHATVSAVVFVPYLIGHYLIGRYWLGMPFDLQLPPQLLRTAIDQIFIIALSEELFFRGYLQTQCDRVWGTPWSFAGARWGVGLPVAAALFALCHIVHGGPARLIVFFPGLWYGWLRARCGTIAVPTVYHAVSNVLMTIMLTSFSA